MRGVVAVSYASGCIREVVEQSGVVVICTCWCPTERGSADGSGRVVERTATEVPRLAGVLNAMVSRGRFAKAIYVPGRRCESARSWRPDRAIGLRSVVGS